MVENAILCVSQLLFNFFIYNYAHKKFLQKEFINPYRKYFICHSI